MQIILLERIEKLGTIGDVVNVDGMPATSCCPTRRRCRANAANTKLFEAQRADIEKRNAEAKAAAEALGRCDGKSVVLIRAASNAGHLYGSVSVRDIVDALVADGAKVSKSQIILERPIKSIGIYDVRVALHPEVSVNVKVNVARSPDEAELQAQGVNVSERCSTTRWAASPKPTTPMPNPAKSRPTCSTNRLPKPRIAARPTKGREGFGFRAFLLPV
jgi:large subunit ribosomal protein L9